MPVSTFFVPRMELIPSYDSQTRFAAARFASVSGYGYNLTAGNLTAVDIRIKAQRAYGGLGIVNIDPQSSVNRNFFTTTATLSTQTVTLAVGSYTFWFQAGAGSITSSNGTGTASNNGAAIVGSPKTITVSAAGTFIFTVSGVVSSAQLESGSTAGTYIARADATAVKVLNIGSLNSAADGTYTNGSSSNMLVSNATAGRVLNFMGSASQSLNLGFMNWYDTYSITVAFNLSSLGGALFIKSNTSDRLVMNADGSIRFNSTSGVVQSAAGQFVTNTWYVVQVTISGLNVVIYKNGVPIVTGTLTTRTTETSNAWNISGSAFVTGVIGDLIMQANVALAQSQVTGLYTAIKARYGL